MPTAPLFDVPAAPLLPVEGVSAGFPVHRIFCVGRNYAAHAAEMGNTIDRAAPFYFTKPPTGLVLSGGTMTYPPGTEDCHHEIELVIAIGAPHVPYHGRGGGRCHFRLCRRPRHDPARPAAGGQGQAAPLGHGQILRGSGGDRADHTGVRFRAGASADRARCE